ncbi:hypothetical protein D3C78_1912270 [compost metagenome]
MGAERYELKVRAPDGVTPLWEATTRNPRLTLLAMPPGGASLEIVALSGPDRRSSRLVVLPQ